MEGGERSKQTQTLARSHAFLQTAVPQRRPGSGSLRPAVLAVVVELLLEVLRL